MEVICILENNFSIFQWEYQLLISRHVNKNEGKHLKRKF